MIGAGSIGFTRGRVQDLLAVPEFAGTALALTDNSRRNRDMPAQFCRRDIAQRIDTVIWIHGGTGGDRGVGREVRIGFETDFPNGPVRPPKARRRSESFFGHFTLDSVQCE